MRKVFYASTYEHAKEAVELFKKKWSMKYLSAVECITDDIGSCMSYYKYPYQHWLRIRTTNLVERSFKEVKRRVKGIGRFQNEKRALTLGLLATQRSQMEWSEHDQRGKGNPYEDTCVKASEDCGINGFMKTVENKALMRIY